MKLSRADIQGFNLERLEVNFSRLKAMSPGDDTEISQAINLIRENKCRLVEMILESRVWETVEIARHPRRPVLEDYLEEIFDDFREMHGDRCFGDDRAIVTGFGRIGIHKVLVVGNSKGRTLKQRYECHHGCALPEGYRKALAKMKLAAKYGVPIVCMIDTPGAYPGIAAEERGQAHAIARNLYEIPRLRVPVVGVIVGEGGSGGALGIGVCDRLAMLQYAYYSVASPEACAAILWRDQSKVKCAAKALRMTSTDLMSLGCIDEIIPEPEGGAHLNPTQAMYNVKRYLTRNLSELGKVNDKILVEKRYERLRSFGRNCVYVPKKAAPQQMFGN